MKVLYKLITILLLLVVFAAGTKLEYKLNEYRLEKITKIETSQEVRQGRDVDFDKLLKRNSDVLAWIYLPDSEIDYPIVQGENNDFYLHRDLDKNYMFEGTLFVDAGNIEPFHDANTVIYGHHMKSGAMFANLAKYSDKDYLKDHSVFQLETPDKSYDLHVVAYCNEPADSDLYQTYAEDFDELVKNNAVYLSGEDFSAADHFVTLSTCAYNYDDARHQVICVVRDAELTEVSETVQYDKPFLNRWLFLQVGAGLLMIFVLIISLKSLRK